VIGGRPRRIRVELDPARLAARRTSALQVAQALRAANVNLRAGQFAQQDRETVADAGAFVGDARELNDLVIRIAGDRPVYLKDVATVIDGPAEVDSYSWVGFGPAAGNPRSPTDEPEQGGTLEQGGTSLSVAKGVAGRKSTPFAALRDVPHTAAGKLFPAVNIAVAKQKGSNAVRVAEAIEARMRELAIPLTMIGIMPGFWLLSVLVDRPVGGYPTPVFFTSTVFSLLVVPVVYWLLFSRRSS